MVLRGFEPRPRSLVSSPTLYQLGYLGSIDKNEYLTATSAIVRGSLFAQSTASPYAAVRVASKESRIFKYRSVGPTDIQTLIHADCDTLHALSGAKYLLPGD